MTRAVVAAVTVALPMQSGTANSVQAGTDCQQSSLLAHIETAAESTCCLAFVKWEPSADERDECVFMGVVPIPVVVGAVCALPAVPAVPTAACRPAALPRQGILQSILVHVVVWVAQCRSIEVVHMCTCTTVGACYLKTLSSCFIVGFASWSSSYHLHVLVCVMVEHSRCER